MLFIGPFKQILTMDGLPKSGPINDNKLEIISNAGILVNGEKIEAILPWGSQDVDTEVYELSEDLVLMPGLIDSHTHICFAGSRAADYSMRLEGKSYLEIANQGGGILDTVKKTRAVEQADLETLTFERAITHLKRGITTCEVKSGYGLDLKNEIKMLKAIKEIDERTKNTVDLIPSCLAAHTLPPEFKDHSKYLKHILEEILPEVIKSKLAKRIDIFIEDGAFDAELAIPYLKEAKKLGFSITVHADQFTQGGSLVAAEVGAVSADHLEVSTIDVIEELARKNVIGTVLPGASLGLGINFAPARMMLDNNLCLAIASDWNPGSAPNGDLLTQAALLSANQKLTNAETLSGITNRAARALELSDRGILKEGMLADMIAFPADDYREILYQQGSLKPLFTWKRGKLLHR